VVIIVIKKLALTSIISSRPSKERDLVFTVVVSHLLYPKSKLATAIS